VTQRQLLAAVLGAMIAGMGCSFRAPKEVREFSRQLKEREEARRPSCPTLVTNLVWEGEWRVQGGLVDGQPTIEEQREHDRKLSEIQSRPPGSSSAAVQVQTPDSCPPFSVRRMLEPER
jgi:hypothetical protein